MILVIGATGFIGSNLAIKILENGEDVVGIDNLNNYYDIKLKNDRVENITNSSQKYESNWKFHKGSICDRSFLESIFQKYKPKVVINLAAQAGVRYSIENPSIYLESNVNGFFNILEECRKNNVENFIYASSSSIYGVNKKSPYNEIDSANHPLSFYAATKKSNEIMAHSYSHIYGIPITGLRLFTVYGEWGRPDMAPMIFADSLIKGKPIKIFNFGEMSRDFTYVDDITEAIRRCCYKPATIDVDFDPYNPNPSTASCPHRIFNVGNSSPVNLLEFINILEIAFNIKAKKEFLPIQDGDVVSTNANTQALRSWIGYEPNTNLKDGIRNFSKWYKIYYKVK